jgi:hypothetical protein
MGIDKKEDIIQPFEKTKPERFGEKVEVVRRLAMKVSIVLAKKMKNSASGSDRLS